MKRLNLQNLETLCSIARLGTFHAAAEHLNATQPAISARIKDLENAIGVPLFHKQGRRMALTIQGRALVHKVEPLLQALEDAVVSVGSPLAATGIVRIGTGEIVALSWLPMLIGQLKALMPKVTYEIDIDLTVPMRHRLENGKIDIAIVAAPIVLNEIESMPLGTVRMLWVIAASRKSKLRPANASPAQLLENLPIWSLPKPSAIYPIAAATLKQFDIKTQDIHTFDTIQGIIELVLDGSGTALLPYVLVQDHLRQGKLVELSPELPESEIEFAIAWNADRERSIIRNIVDMAVSCSTFPRSLEPGR